MKNLSVKNCLFFGSVWKYMEGESWWTLLTWITKLAQKVTSDVMELFVKVFLR